MIVAKIYEKNGKLVLENCNQFIEKVLYPSGKIEDTINLQVKIIGAKYIAISPEAKKMLLNIFENASYKKGCVSDLILSTTKTNKIVFGWYGSNKRIIDIDRVKDLEIDNTNGMPDISLIEEFILEDNEFLKNLTISQINWNNAYKACVCEK